MTALFTKLVIASVAWQFLNRALPLCKLKIILFALYSLEIASYRNEAEKKNLSQKSPLFAAGTYIKGFIRYSFHRRHVDG